MGGCFRSTRQTVRVEVDCFDGLRTARVVADWVGGLSLDRVRRFNLDLRMANEGIGTILGRVRLEEDEDDTLPLVLAWKLNAFKVEKLRLVGITGTSLATWTDPFLLSTGLGGKIDVIASSVNKF
ncbi:hypothetical protein SLEP1_g13056 [Rubroshorea leprosula]|uniref:Uncharacterized protein n=1 Tax=Rubroshorea leprosula TaxID=152421 RepID=A0AAV5IP00_9ROSI|nr:hypothetical protein SLEP1_g13056 [Rubroshorea leprosula]